MKLWFGLQILDRITKSVDTATRHYFSEYMVIEGKISQRGWQIICFVIPVLVLCIYQRIVQCE